MSNRVALNGRSMCDKHMRDQNTHKPFLNHMEARLVPKPPIFESQGANVPIRSPASQ